MKCANCGHERNENMLIQSRVVWMARLRMKLNLIVDKVLRCYRKAVIF